MWSCWLAASSTALTVFCGDGSSHCFPFPLWTFEVFSCRASTICTRSAQPCPNLPNLQSASTAPLESRTLLLRWVSRRPVLPHQSKHRCRYGRPFSLADSVAETCTTPAPLCGSVARELSGPLLGPLSGLTSKCWPPLTFRSLRPSGSSTSARPATHDPCRDGAGPVSQPPPRAQVPPLSSFTFEGCATGLALVLSSVAVPVRQRWLN